MMSRTPKQCVDEILKKGMENFVPPIPAFEEPDTSNISALDGWEYYVGLMAHHQGECDMWMAILREMASQLKVARTKHQAATKHIKDAKAETERAIAQAAQDEVAMVKVHMKTNNELVAAREELERVSMLYEGEAKMSAALARQIIDTRKERDTALLDRDSARRERDQFIKTATKETQEYLELLSLAHAAQERLEKELQELKPTRAEEYGTPLNSEDLRESKNEAGAAGQADIPPQ